MWGCRHNCIEWLLPWGGLQKHGVKNKIEFLTLFWDIQKKAQRQGLSTTNHLLDQHDASTRGARLASAIQAHVYIDVPQSGNMLTVRGGMHTPAPVPTAPRKKWVPWVTNLTASNKGLQTAWPEKCEKWFCLRSQHCIFFTKLFAHFFTMSPEIFRTFFHDFFRTIFRTIFHTAFLADFFTHPFYTFFKHTCSELCIAERVSIVCGLSTAQLSPKQDIPLLVDQARHSWPNTGTNKSFRRHLFGKTSAKFSLCRNPTINDCAI